MIKFLVWGLLLYIGYRIIISISAPKKNASKSAEKMDSAEVTHRDPVCGVYVSEEQAVVGRLNGERHYFCSMDCLEKFRDKLDQITT